LAAIARFPNFLTALTAAPGRRRMQATLIQVAAWCVSMVVIAWVVSGWFWDIMAPRSSPTAVPSMNSDPQAVARAVATRHLFGQTGSGRADAPAPGARYRVIGLMTASHDSPGVAILDKDGARPKVALEGDEIEPGVTLVKVLPGQARLLVDGRSETIDAPKLPAPVGPVGATSPSAPANVRGVQPIQGMRPIRARP
jgi:hypothetical protein